MTHSKRDHDLQLAVIDELSWDTRVEGTEIGVIVQDGVVTLTGTVECWAEKHAAQEAAHRVRGVHDVANDIVIKPAWNLDQTDADLARAAREALDWNVYVPKPIDIDVADGVVNLSGTVETLRQRADVETAIRPLRGVRGIENAIVVEPPPVTEEEIRRSITDALARHVARESNRIAIEVTSDHVRLSGHVDSRAEHDAALGAVVGTRGVRSIEDQIRFG